MSTSTPWGKADYVKKYAAGIIWYSTPSHGGFHVCPTKNLQIPEYMREAGGWYEEDCDWAIVATIFPAAFLADKDPAWTLQQARDTLKNWNPKAYEYIMKLDSDDVVAQILIRALSQDMAKLNAN